MHLCNLEYYIMNNEQNTQYKFLSELKNGESGVITKVKGYGAFRKRINEMGFVAGTTVKVIKKAPLQDPIEYELMGYRVSLRESEAELIEVISNLDGKTLLEKPFAGTILCDSIANAVKSKQKTINIALVGNPNSGKTTLFNHATGHNERVGNYGGVTIEMKTARLTQNGYTVNITDLPGTYSISEYSPEELYVRKHLSDEMPDVVVNIVDASNIERNLFLTSQLIDMNIKVVIALNMYDELEDKGDRLNYETLGKMMGIPMVPVIAKKGKGIAELFNKVIDVYEENESEYKHIHINYGKDINNAIEKLRKEIKNFPNIVDKYHQHYAAIKLLENDLDFTNEISNIAGSDAIIACAEKERLKLEKEYKENSTAIITDAKYAFIRGALKETYRAAGEAKRLNYAFDTILTHKWFGIPFFIFFMWLMFQATFTLGNYPMEWIEAGVSSLSDWLSAAMPNGMLKDLFIDGIIAGVGGVIVFLPNILILFFFISLMEGTGYMARAAFIMDKLMRKIGLHGKSFIPLIMGFGCGVPAIMATRTLDNRKDRILTMLITPLMSCGARLPVYTLLIAAFFPTHQGSMLFAVYACGILAAILVALVMKKLFFKNEDVPFVMELPPYRIPTLKATSLHMWQKAQQYLRKMSGIILVASIIIWALGYFPRQVEFSQDYNAQIAEIESAAQFNEAEKAAQITPLELAQEAERLEKSYIGKLGHAVEPIIRPLGYDWRMGVSIITGLAAKEIVLSSMGILYQADMEADGESTLLVSKLQSQTYTSGNKTGEPVFTPLIAFGFMLFILLYFPCIAVISAIRKEAGWGWAVFTMVYTTALAWIIAFAVYQIGSLC